MRVTIFAAVVFLWSSTTHAQSVGFLGGGLVDPEQFYVGTFFETAPIAERVRVRPGVDGSWGSDLKIASINIDIIYRTIVGSDWRFYTGGGPTILIIRPEEPGRPGDPLAEDDVTGGLTGLIGFAHSSGFFTEFKFGRGGNRGPSLKFGAGIRFGGNGS